MARHSALSQCIVKSPEPRSVQTGSTRIESIEGEILELMESWGARVASAISNQLPGDSGIELLRLDFGADFVEAVFRASYLPVQLLGIHLDAQAVQGAPARMRENSPEQVGFEFFHLGICEPKTASEFAQPDESGVAWLLVAQWLADIA